VECWSAGVLECWSAGVLECWSAGVVERWRGGEVEWWSAIEGLINDCYLSPLPIPFEPLILISARLHYHYH
jgi:hypothetical protein